MRTPKHLICTKNFCSHCDIRSCLQRATEEEARRGTGAVRFIIHAYFHVIKLLEIVHQAVLPRMAIQSDSPTQKCRCKFTCWRQLIRGTECFIYDKIASLASVRLLGLGKRADGIKFANQKETTAQSDSDQHSLHPQLKS